MSDQLLPPGYAETDIAIVGRACRFPGASDVSRFWENIRGGVDAAVWMDEDELRENGVTDEDLANPDYVRACHPIEDMEGFDAGFFGFSPREASIMDPQQRHFLELAWSAMEDAGHAPERFPGSVGVFAGCGASLYLMRNLLTNRDLAEDIGFFLLRHTGNDKDFLATRVSYLMNLTGPSVNVQTACSTSLVAVHLACQSLLFNECDMALAGGSTLKQPHRIGYEYVEGEILSPDGKCRTFDADAEGTVFGSGTGVVVLRRLTDALRDGDTIHAVIKGTAVNNDGSAKVGYLAPSVDAQARNMAEALAVSGVEPGDVGYIECHGTATPVGDPIEVVALAQAFSEVTERSSVAIGSVKTNIGHLDTAAGVAGLLKAVEALKHAEIPPSLHFERPNPGLDIENTPFYVADRLHDWPKKGAHRVAGVTALGAGGTNAHVILQEAPAPVKGSPPTRRTQVLPLSAKTPSALDAASASLAAFLEGAPEALEDVAFTLQNGRQAFEHRRFVVADDAASAASLLGDPDPRAAPTGAAPDLRRSVTFMFAGGGAQYPGMGAGLYRAEPEYRAAVDECVALLQPQLDWSLKSLLFADGEDVEAAAREMQRPSRSLPCLFITQYAMARLLMSWGVDPAAMIGHSMGEYTAAHLAGVFSLADALSLVTVRGKLFETVPPGGMLSVPLGADELEARLPAELSIAAVNAPGLCVASGPVDALDALEAELAREDIECSRIHIDIAAHSSMLEPILQEFGTFCQGISYAKPERPFVSNVSGTWITPEEATDPQYWVRHLRHTVRFADGVGVLLEDEGRVFVEVGPGRVLATLAGLHESKQPAHAMLTTMRHPAEDADDVAVALGTIGRLWLSGFDVAWDRLAPEERRRRVALPTYPFEHQPYFIQPGEITAPKPTLARRADTGSWTWRPSWTRETLTLAPPEALGSEGTWLVLCDESGVGAGVAQRLEALGARVVTVLAGSGFQRDPDGSYRVDPGNASDFEALVSGLEEADAVPTRIVHAWAATDGPVGEDRTFFSLLNLVKALGNAGSDHDLRLDVVTTGGQLVGGEAALEPDRSLVLGPVRVAPKEFPNIRARAIDLPHPSSGGWFEDRAVVQVLSELAHDDEVELVAWRGSDRFVPTFEEVPLPPAADDETLTRDGAVWLVTGGLGGLGSLVAEELARRAKVRLVLTSRSGARTPVVSALEALGAEVLVLAADVADEAAMERVVRETHAAFGPINGIVHAAGVIEDALTLMKESDSAARVLAPKVRGTLVLERVTRGEPLERVIYFSSRGAVAGVAGQIDYTSASAFLDAHALRRSQIDGVPALSLNWSAWQGVGLAAGVGSSRGTEHPLLERCVVETETEREYRTTMSPDDYWLLDGHRLKSGEALIPGTGYLELIAAGAEETGRRSTLELQDVFFFSPFMVQDGSRRDLRVRIETEGADLDVSVEGRAGAGQDWEEHARGTVAAVDRAVPAFDLSSIRGRCASRTVEFSEEQQRNPNLRLGRRWSNLRRLHFGGTEALAELSLPEDVADEAEGFRLHPALLDVACACAQELVPDFEFGAQFFIPVSYGRVTVYDSLPAEAVSHIRIQPGAGPDADSAVYDITIATPDGRVVVDIKDFTMMRVGEGVGGASSGGAAAGAGGPLQLQDAITPEEGLDVFRRVLASRLLGDLIVSPQHLTTYLQALKEPELPDGGGPGAIQPPPQMDLVDATEVEEALAEHEAIEEVVVLAHEVDGEVKASAFVVWELGEQVTIAELRRFVSGKVEERLIPEQLVELDEMPRTADGDVDRFALPDPFAPVDDYAAPQTDMEKTIAAIWMELLGVPRVSLHDNFLDVGGHSLLAMRAISRISKQTGVRLNPSVMTLNTLSQIAAECEAGVGAAS